MAHEAELKQAISFIKSGQKTEAIAVLKKILKDDRNNEPAWLWLSTCANNDADKKYCLRQALQINPGNEKVKQALAKLEEPEMPTLDDLRPAQAPPAQVAAVAVAPAQPAKKRTSLLAYVLVTVLICLCLFVALNQFGGGTVTGTHTIEYVVEGTARSAMITYTDGSMNMSQATVNLPWRKSFDMKNGALPSLVAQNQGGGVIECKILLDGQAWKESNATNPYGICTNNGMVGQ